jgi:hypothetical protein
MPESCGTRRHLCLPHFSFSVVQDAITGELMVPVKLIGVGEGIDDLLDFDATDFSNAILA